MNLGGAIHINKTGVIVIAIVFTLIFVYLNSKSGSQSGEQLAKTLSLRRLLQVSVKAAQNGGVEVVSASKHDLEIASKGKTKEGLDDTVTVADCNSHCAMVGTLKSAFPNLVVVSEEQKTNCHCDTKTNDGVFETFDLNDELVEEKDLTVWIDPLDATLEYTQQLHEYVTMMVCVALKGRPVIGVIHNPFMKNTSWAWVDHGKSSNLKKIQLPSLEKQKTVTVVVSRSHPGQVKEVLQKQLTGRELVIKTAAGAGYKVLEVAGGLADAYIHTTEIKKWDICAGNAILTELGGRMTTKEGDIIDYSDVNNVVNAKGLVATLRNHEYFVGKL